jgi:hypothetical protein
MPWIVPLVVVGGIIYGVNKLSDEGEEVVEMAAEEVIKFVVKLFASIYSLVLGFPGYVVDSLMYETVGFVDPLRGDPYDEQIIQAIVPGFIGSGPVSNWIDAQSERRNQGGSLTYRVYGTVCTETEVSTISYAKLGQWEETRSMTITYEVIR